MKILHTSDLHIGKSRKLPDYLGRQRQMLNEIYRIAKSREIDLLLVAGDIFDTKMIYPREKDMFLQWVLKLDALASEQDFSVIIMDGNHDLLTEGYTHLRFLRVLQDEGHFKCTDIVEIEPTLIRKGNVFVGCVPAKYYNTEQLNTIVNSLYLKANKLAWGESAPVENKRHPELKFIAMVHECILGSMNSIGWLADKGPQLDPDLPVDYWALGDIHKYQQVRGVPNAWYSGSPIQHDFSDTDRRGILIVDLDQPTKPEFVELQGVTKLVTLTEIPDEWEEDQIVRLEATPDVLAKTDLPANVVATKPVVNAQKAIDAVRKDDMLHGLPEILAAMGVTPDDQETAIDTIRKLYVSD